MTISETINQIIESPKNSQFFLGSLPQIESEYTALINLLNGKNPPFIYGVNSLVGHLDNHRLSTAEVKEFQNELLENHSIDLGFGYYNNWQVQCIFYAKLLNIKNGGTGISPELFLELIKIYSENNYTLKIPVNSSYSCGDVIPAANFIKELSNYFSEETTIKDKDGISLINGNFVSLGLSFSILPRLLKTLDNLISNTVDIFTVFSIDYKILKPDSNSNLLTKDIYSKIESISKGTKFTSQTSVSLRAALKNIDLLYRVLLELNNFITELSKQPSDNPLIFESEDVLSNSSFYSPFLAVKLSSIIETLLFCAWNVERRIHYILSGKIENTVQNFSTSKNRLGLIQIPKMVSNILQNMRLDCGTRNFTTGSETSYGIEDSWSGVEKLIQQISKLSNQFDKILSIEQLIISYYINEDYPEFKNKLTNIPNSIEINSTYNYKFVKNL
ncbi:aromatic amino acid lyase [Streptococcus suis]|nr:aromatic amino acid lyase [Streptococcus suis]NQJ77343.1 aromatic amino acid lyase [Streptococcus suis]